MWLPSPEECKAFHPDWAISTALQVELCDLLASRRPASILELGSGLSTLIFRQYATETAAEFVSLEQADTGLLTGFYPTYAAPQKPFDMILLDGPRGTAQRVGRAASRFLRPRAGKLIVIDDTHRPPIAAFAAQLARDLGYSLRSVADTNFRRSSLILERV